MGWLNRLELWADEQIEKQRRSIGADFSFEEGTSYDAPPKTTVKNVRRMMALNNPLRWRRMQKDFAWLQRHMKRAGLNPEDARWIL